MHKRPRFVRPLSLAVALAVASVAACSSSDGDPTYYRAPTATGGAKDAGAGDAKAGGDAAATPPQPTGISGPSTWSAIYGDYFAATAPGNCAGSPGNCHGAATDQGAKESSFVCADKDGCFTSATSDASGVVLASDAADPLGSRLINVLRKSYSAGGRMPKDGTFAFAKSDVDRIAAWIAAGAQDD